MLSVLMLLALPEPETAIDAERAFNRSAQIDGQWTAFRKFSTPDAVMFVPKPVTVHDWLPAKDPPIAVQWWPAESYVSCDGMVAVNTGPWVRPKGVGYFTTVWVRQPDGRFKWVYDAGAELATPRPLPEMPKIKRASCNPQKALFNMVITIVMPEAASDSGSSPDGTLRWGWSMGENGDRDFRVLLWDGERFESVLNDFVTAK